MLATILLTKQTLNENLEILGEKHNLINELINKATMHTFPAADSDSHANYESYGK